MTKKEALKEIELAGKEGRRANLKGANLEGANLYGAYLKGAYLKGAYLYGVYLYGANLEGANLKGANLKGAYLYGANLYGANLKGANLYGANLERANLERANLYNCKHVKTFQAGKHFAFSYQLDGQTYVQIGCHHKTIEDWLTSYKSIGEDEGYTLTEIKDYGIMLKATKEMWGLSD